jgi:hypothetical protein
MPGGSHGCTAATGRRRGRQRGGRARPAVPGGGARAGRGGMTPAGVGGALASVAAFGDRLEYVRVDERPARWDGLDVTPGLFAVLGVTPALGRVPAAADLRADAPQLFLGHDRWHQDFAGDPGVVGRTLAMGSATYTVAGVLPRGLEFPLGRSPQGGSGSGFRLGAQDFWIVQGPEAHRGGDGDPPPPAGHGAGGCGGRRPQRAPRRPARPVPGGRPPPHARTSWSGSATSCSGPSAPPSSSCRGSPPSCCSSPAPTSPTCSWPA